MHPMRAVACVCMTQERQGQSCPGALWEAHTHTHHTARHAHLTHTHTPYSYTHARPRDPTFSAPGASSPLVGSSRKMSGGLPTSSQPSDSRFFSPPDRPLLFASPTIVLATCPRRRAGGGSVGRLARMAHGSRPQVGLGRCGTAQGGGQGGHPGCASKHAGRSVRLLIPELPGLAGAIHPSVWQLMKERMAQVCKGEWESGGGGGGRAPWSSPVEPSAAPRVPLPSDRT